MKFWLLSLLCIMTTQLSAEEPTEELDLNNKFSQEWASLDNPKALIPWAKQQFETTDMQQNPQRWVRTLWFYSNLGDDWENLHDAKNTIKKAIVIAERERMYEEFIDLRNFLPGIIESASRGSSEPVDSISMKKEHEEIISEAQRIGLKRAEAEALATFAYYLRDIGETHRSLQLLLEATRLMAEDPESNILSQMRLKNNLAIAFSFEDQEERALSLYLEVNAFCKKVRLRSFCQTNYYNLGKLMVDSDDLEIVAKADVYLNQALKIGLEISDRFSTGASHSGLISFHTKLKKYRSALNHVEIASKIFTEIKNDVWLADTHKRRARILFLTKKHEAALNYIDLARKLFPKDFRRDFLDLDELSYQIYRELGETKKSLDFLEKHHAAFKEITKEKGKADFSRLMVTMGLQIEQEKNKVLSKDNELKNQILKETESMRIFMLAIIGLMLLVMASLATAVFRTREVKISRMKMQRILDNIEEGILTVNSKMKIESEYSQYLKILLNTNDDLTGGDAMDRLLSKSTMTKESQSMVIETLRVSMGENEFQWTLNEQNLPRELVYSDTLGTRIMAVHWKPLYDKNQRIQSILIGLIDVTETRKLETEITAERDRTDRQGQRIRELAQINSDRVDDLIRQSKSLQSLFSKTLQCAETRLLVRRELHTIKGIARTLGLRELSAISHDLEDNLQNETTGLNLDEAIFEPFQDLIAEYNHIISNIFSRKNLNLKATERSLIEVVEGILPSLKDQLSAAGMALSGLQIVDMVMSWPQQLLQSVEQILVHALSNAVDHGFVLPKQRGQPVQSPIFHIEATYGNNGLQLTVRDNGIGLDLEKLAALAASRGFKPDPGRSIADVVFIDGFTTAEKVSRTSGRGVGLSAINGICHEWNGEVHMEPAPRGQGAQLSVLLTMKGLKTSA
ncbi:MAG TPA: ATP-binding protein [Oligoflexus sp.]|uniref:ATP-binding protein n=1 Tax=Oligoflexus sp. TaxID=1971216 RepID=UPI002D40F021|nr:ATP-binding protein [Oligoflexus sp.]HYX33360.1 ATP-binding protein [Oligoflexus sp.]